MGIIKKDAVKSVLKEFGAGNEARTRDPDLGKVVLYQLSYSRVVKYCRKQGVLYGCFSTAQAKFFKFSLFA